MESEEKSDVEIALGKPVAVYAALLRDDPAAKAIAAAGLECSCEGMPILCREVDGGLSVLSPLPHVQKLRQEEAAGFPAGTVEVRVLEGMTDSDARLVAELGDWWCHRAENDEWRDEAEMFRVKLAPAPGRPWLRKSGTVFMAAALGTCTSTIHRIIMLQREGAPELRALVDEGYISTRTAYDYVALPKSEQAAAAKAVKRMYPTPPESAALVTKVLKAAAGDKLPSTNTLLVGLESKADAMATGAAAAPSVETAERIAAAAAKIMREAIRRETFKEAKRKGLCA